MSKGALDKLTVTFGDAITETSADYGDDVAVVARGSIAEVARYVKDELGFDMPVFCTCIDHLGSDRARFEMVYQLRSTASKTRLRLKIVLDDDKPTMPTLAGVWPGFDWLEREAFDMYGVQFEGHPDLRRIYLYDEFVGYPLRKDYPKEKRQPLVRRDWGNE